MISPVEKNEAVEGQFLIVKIRVVKSDYERGLPYFGSRRKLNEFIVEAFKEKVNRAEANDKAAKRQQVITNAALLEPVIRELHEQGKLNFLNKP
jgi:hypothetical protein